MRSKKFRKPAKWLLLGCLTFGQFTNAHAREDLVPGSRYTSDEGASMGDAVLPLAQDGPSSLFYNPAGLTRIRETTFEPANISFYGNSGYLGNLSPGSAYKVTSLSGFQSNLQTHPGVFEGTGGQYLASFYTRGFAIGVLAQDQIGAVSNSNGSTNYRSLYQLIPTAGYGMRFAGGIVRVGYSLQWVNEATGNVTVPAATSPLGYNQNLSQGSALSHNVGAAITLPYTYLPAFNVVARNIGGAHYSATSLYSFSPNSTGAPATDPMSIDSSFSLVSKLGGGNNINWVLEDRDMTNTSGMVLAGRLAAGIEYSDERRLFLRGGWGSGYPAAGIAYRLNKNEIGLSWYSEELGESYHSLRDERLMFSFAVHAF